MSCLLSIVIPVYQVEPYLKRCVDSVLAQKFPSYEIILVNDGSSDLSPKICDDYAQKYPHISVIHKVNGGLSDARNVGLLAANGDYVFFLDSDDWIDKKMLEELSEVLNSQKYDIISFRNRFCYTEDVNDENLPFIENIFTGEEAFNEMLAWQHITSYATDKIFKKSLFINNLINFPKGYFFEDLGTIYKLLLVSDKVYTSNQVYYYYYLNNATAITQDYSIKKIEDMYNFYKEIYHIGLTKETIDKVSLSAYFTNGIVHLLTKLYGQPSSNKELVNRMKEDLELSKVPIVRLRNYPQFKKYVLYRFGMLKLIITLRKLALK